MRFHLLIVVNNNQLHSTKTGVIYCNPGKWAQKESLRRDGTLLLSP